MRYLSISFERFVSPKFMFSRHDQRWGYQIYSKLKLRIRIYAQTWFFFTSKLLARGYTESEVQSCLADTSYNRRKFYLEDVSKHTTEIPLVFCTHHYPQRSNAKIKRALLKNWHYISSHPKLCTIFPCPPILALRRTKNLGERLIRAKITLNSEKYLTPTVHEEDASSEIGYDGPMSPTLIDLLALLDENT